MTLLTSQTEIKQITLCADDYGQNTVISEGIVHLAEQGRINATSCMVNSEAWNETYQPLYALQSSTYIGLHFNLTHGAALSPDWKKKYGASLPGLASLLKQSCFRRLNPTIIATEIKAQVDAYTLAMNAYPDFIDGHQHIHQLPVIRDALLGIYADLPVGIFIRKTCNGWGDVLSTDGFPKRQSIALLGGIAFQKCLAHRALPANTSFSGIYNFKDAINYRHYFNEFLKHSQDGGLIMCHPGNSSDDISDPLRLYRHYERDYFMSDEYLSDLKSHSFQLKRKETQ